MATTLTAAQELTKANAKLDSAENELTAAKDELTAAKAELTAAKAETLSSPERIAKAELDVAEAKLGVAKAEWESAGKPSYGTYKDQLEGAQKNVDVARNGVQLAQQAYTNALGVTSPAQGSSVEILQCLNQMDGSLNQIRSEMDGRLKSIECTLHDDNSSEAISHYPVEKYRRLLGQLKLDPMVVDWKLPEAQSKKVKAFKWNDETEPKQISMCEKFIGDNIMLPSSCILQSVDKKSHFLDTAAKTMGTSVGIRGTSDLAILDKKLHEQGFSRSAIRLLVELKKSPTDPDVQQAVLQLISASTISCYPPVVVLTDLGVDWRFYWLFESKICIMQIQSPSDGFNFINMLLQSQCENKRGNSTQDISLPEHLIKRTKLSVAQASAMIPAPQEYDDYQDGLMTDEERVEADHKRIKLFAMESIPWMVMYS